MRWNNDILRHLRSQKLFSLSALRNFREHAPPKWGRKTRMRKSIDKTRSVQTWKKLLRSPLGNDLLRNWRQRGHSWLPLAGNSFGICLSFWAKGTFFLGGPSSTTEQGGDKRPSVSTMTGPLKRTPCAGAPRGAESPCQVCSPAWQLSCLTLLCPSLA